MVKFEGTAQEWNKLLSNFKYCNMYQTYEWGQHKENLGWEVARFTQQKDGKCNFMIQMQIKRLPLSGAIIWIPGGFLGEFSQNDFKKIFSTLLIKFYVVRSSFSYFDQVTHENLKSNKWSPAMTKINSGLSFTRNLKLKKDELGLLMSKNWRHNLRRAHKKESVFTKLEEISTEKIRALYLEMESRKGLGVQFSKEEIESMQKNLNAGDLHFYIAKSPTGEVLAFRAFYQFLNKAWDLFAVTTNEGRKVYASYGLLNLIMEDMIDLGVEFFDLSGADPEKNKGNYNFKKGSGANFVTYLGEWEYSNIPFLKLAFNQMLKVKGF